MKRLAVFVCAVALLSQPLYAGDALLVFTAKWCPACVQMERHVWPKIDTTRFKVYTIDVDKPGTSLTDYKIVTIPTIIKGKEEDGKFIEEKRNVGSMTIEETKKFLGAP